MRKIKILVVGKDKDDWLSGGTAHYRKLLGRYASVEIEVIPKGKSTAAGDPNRTKSEEGTAFLKSAGRDSFVALHHRGEPLNSAQFARLLDKLTASQRGPLVFVIGGAYGLDNSVLSAAKASISLSPLTFSHQIVRLVLLEQVYRAFTILEGTDYHK